MKTFAVEKSHDTAKPMKRNTMTSFPRPGFAGKHSKDGQIGWPAILLVLITFFLQPIQTRAQSSLRDKSTTAKPDSICLLRHPASTSPGFFTVTFSPNGNFVVARDRANRLVMFDLQQQRKRYDWQAHDSNWMESIHFSPDGAFMVSTAGSGESVKVWNSESGKLQLEIPTTATTAVFSATGNGIMVLGSSQVEAYSWPGGLAVGRASWQLGNEAPLTMSEDGNIVVMARQVNQQFYASELLNLRSKLRSEMPGEASRPRQLSISGDGYWAAGCYDDSPRLYLWKTADPGNAHFVLGRHQAEIMAIAFSHDSRFLLSADREKKLVLWDLLTRQPITDFEIDQESIRSLAFSPKRFQFACGGVTDTDSSLWVGDLSSMIFGVNSARPNSFLEAWDRLGSSSPTTALQTVHSLLEHFDDFQVALREEVFRNTYENTPSDLETLLQQLADPRFLTREQASRALSDRLSHFDSSLRQMLKQELPIETRYRIRRILIDQPVRPPIKVKSLRQWQRLVFLLELRNDQQSRSWLQRIAIGHLDTEISAAAESALQRSEQVSLDQRP